MGTIVNPQLSDFYQEDVGSGVSVSSFLASKLAGNMQLYKQKMLQVYEFGATGSYYPSSLPVTGLGTKEILEFDFEIVNVWVINEISGTSGTTEVDILYAPVNTTTYNSIFTVTPKFTSASANDSVTDVLSKSANATGVTRPTLATTLLSAGNILRFDLKNAMQGGASVTVKLHLRLR